MTSSQATSNRRLALRQPGTAAQESNDGEQSPVKAPRKKKSHKKKADDADAMDTEEPEPTVDPANVPVPESDSGSDTSMGDAETTERPEKRKLTKEEAKALKKEQRIRRKKNLAAGIPPATACDLCKDQPDAPLFHYRKHCPIDIENKKTAKAAKAAEAAAKKRKSDDAALSDGEAETRAAKKTKKKAEKEVNTTEEQAAGEKKGDSAKPAKKEVKKASFTQPTKRAAKGNESSVYGDGTYMVVTLPPGLSMDDGTFASAVAGTKLNPAPCEFGYMDGRNWFLRFKNEMDAEASKGKQVLVDAKNKVALRPYLTGGPSTFFADKKGAYSEDELAIMINAQYPKTKFWLARQVTQGMYGQKRLVKFEKQMDMNTFAVKKGADGYEVRFRPMTLSNKCMVCGQGHETDNCGQWECTPLVEGLEEKLPSKPL